MRTNVQFMVRTYLFVGIAPLGEFREVNGQTALVARVDGQAWSCLSIEVVQEQIQVMRILVNPDKLTRL